LNVLRRRLTTQHSLDEHSHFESLARNRVSNISFAISSAGEVLILAVIVGILKAVKSDASVQNNTKAFSVLLAFTGGVWCSFPISINLCACTPYPRPQCFVLFLGSSLKSADRVSHYLRERHSRRLDSSRHSSRFGSVCG